MTYLDDFRARWAADEPWCDPHWRPLSVCAGLNDGRQLDEQVADLNRTFADNPSEASS